MPLIPVNSTTSSRQALIDANPTSTSFCFEAGSHSATGSNTPKSGNTFTGQFGATIDGTSWSSGDDDAAVFRAHNVAIVNVTVRNLTMQNLPQRAVHAYPWDDCTGWIIENCEIANCGDGIQVGSDFIIRRNKIHNCHRVGHPSGLLGAALGGFGNFATNTLDNVLVEDNELYDFGGSQKLGDATNCIWRRNHIHNVTGGPAIWNDGVGNGTVIEDNTIEDCERGIMFEMSIGGIIRRNTVRRSADQAIFISTSRDCDIYDNVLEDNLSGVEYFIDCSNTDANHVPVWGWSPDLSDNTTHDNRIVVPNTGGVLGCWFTYSGAGCPGAQSDDYINNVKNNNFSNNEYIVPNLSGSYWLNGGGVMNFTAWQALPRDAGSTISL